MKLQIKKTIKTSLTFFIISMGVMKGVSQTTLTVDPAKPWVGYMNVFDLSFNYQFGQTWGTADLQAFFDPTGTNTLTLLANTNVYDPNNSYWVANGTGAKNMDASFYVQNDALEGQSLTFNGTCLTNSLVSPYTSTVFIKEFDNNYNIVNEDVATPVAGQPFSLFLVTGSGSHIQYGFETIGPDANPSTLSSLGSVVYAVNTADPTISTVAGQAAVQGQNATFSVTAKGTSPFYYQWTQAAAGVTNVLSNGNKYAGATNSTLTISNVTVADVGVYTVTVTNSAGSASSSASLVVVPLAQAQTNLLIDPSFESGIFDPSGTAGWNDFSGSVFANTNNFYYDSSVPVSVENGTNCVQVYAAGTYNGFYQDKPALPGQVYTASIWFLTPSVDQIAGVNDCFLEVQFRDGGGNILQDYESPVINSSTASNVWINFTPPGTIVSPAGTVSVRFQVTYYNGGAGGSVYVDNADLRLRAPAATAVAGGSNFQITFPTVAGPTYQVLYKAHLTDATWTLLTSVTGDGNTHTVADPIGAAGRFYIVNTQ